MSPAFRLPAFVGLSALAAIAAACGGDDGPVDPQVDCELETRDDDFFIPLTKPGKQGLIDFTLVTATPAPPQRFDNLWTVQLNQKAGAAAPIDGATLVVTPYMPDHGHLSPFEPGVTAIGTPGQYELDPVHFSMPSLWEITIEAETPSGNDSVVFKFCVRP